MYAYNSARCVSQWTPSERKKVEVKLRGEAKSSMEPFAEWQEWTGVICAGAFQCADLVIARNQLLQSGRNPRITMRSMTELGGFSYKCVESVDGCKGRCTFRETPPYADEIQKWLKNLGDPVVYCGEKLPGITLKVLLQLMTCERRTPKPNEKAAILQRQQSVHALWH